MQMFGHRIKYIYIRITFAVLFAEAPNRLRDFRVGILSFYHAPYDKLSSVHIYVCNECMCMCVLYGRYPFFHEESSCRIGRHNARQMVPKTYIPLSQRADLPRI